MLSQHTMEQSLKVGTFHKLSDKWTLWAHLPHNTDWSLKGYIPVFTFTTLEETVSLIQKLPLKLVENCMLFIMRDGIHPMWEDPQNRDGGCFSYKVLSNNIYVAWKELTYATVGGSISTKKGFFDSVAGITISPKKKFCIIKIWMKNCDYQNPTDVIPIRGLQSTGCLFKKHAPEY